METQTKKAQRKPRLASALTGLGLATLLLSPVLQTQARAQGPQDNGGPGGPPPGGQGGPGGFNGGGANRRAPFAFGTVTAVDAGSGTITLSSRGGSQTIQTQGTTQIVTQSSAAVSDLKVGDQVQVQGVPTGLTASTLTIGASPLVAGGAARGAAATTTGGTTTGTGGAATGAGASPQSFAVATGTVSSTSPLTLTLSGSVSLVLKMATNAKVARFTTLALSGVKVGDRIMATGQAGDDGTWTASSVGVNVDTGGMGLGQGGPGGMGQRGMQARAQQGGGDGPPPPGMGGPQGGGDGQPPMGPPPGGDGPPMGPPPGQ